MDGTATVTAESVEEVTTSPWVTQVAIKMQHYRELESLLKPGGNYLVVVAGEPLRRLRELGYGEEWDYVWDQASSTSQAIEGILDIARNDRDHDDFDSVEYENPAMIVPNIDGYRPDAADPAMNAFNHLFAHD